MSFILPEAIETYAQMHSSPESELFQELVKVTQEKMDLPQMQTGHLEASFLKFLVQILNPQLIVEVGTFTGYSAMAMAEGLGECGKIITCDMDPECTKIAKGFWNRHPKGKHIELRLGPAIKTLMDIEGAIDFAFIDADKPNYVSYWEAIVPKLRVGGVIAVDNVLWSGNVLNPKTETDQAIVDFNRHALSDARMEKVMLTIRDGITVARKLPL